MRSKGMLYASLAVAALLIAAAWFLYTLLVRAPAELASAAAQGVRELLQVTPQVKIDQTVVIEQSTPIMELATVARQAMVDYSWKHTWLGSTKEIHLNGAFTAKAGFNLHEPFTLTVRQHPLRVSAQLPAARLLSLTMDSYRVVADEDGWWNKISSADRERAVQALQDAARSRVLAAGILTETDSTARQRIREVIERNGAAVDFLPTIGGQENM